MVKVTLMKERDLCFDILKGILIFTVVWGHSIGSSGLDDIWHNNLFNAIYLFHMPLFIFISGYFCHSIITKDFNDVLMSKTKRLIIPYLSFTIIGLIIYFSSSEYKQLCISICNKSDIFQLAKALFNIVTEYWYLPCVFVLTIVYYPVLKAYRQRSYFIISLLIFVVWVLTLLFSSYYPFVLLEKFQISRQTIVFGLGLYYFYKKDKMCMSLKMEVLVLSLICALLNFHFSGYWFCEFNIIQKIINGVFCTIISFAVLYHISLLIRDMIVGKILAFVGRNTLFIYLIHFLFLSPLHLLLCPYLGSDFLGVLFVTLLNVVISLIVSSFVKIVLKQHSYFLGVA